MKLKIVLFGMPLLMGHTILHASQMSKKEEKLYAKTATNNSCGKLTIDNDLNGKLFFAIENQDLKEIKRLLNGHYKRRIPDITQKLNAFVNSIYQATKMDEVSPLLFALIKNDHEDIAKELIDHGARLNDTDRDGNTPLIIATRKNFIGMVKLLLEYQVSPNVQNNEGMTALMIAVNYGHTEIAKLLIAAGAELEIKDWSALFSAIFQGRKDIIQLLINAGANVNSANKNGQTLLFTTVWDANPVGGNRNWQDAPEVIKMLVAAGADLDAQDSENETIYDLMKNYPLDLQDQIKKAIDEGRAEYQRKVKNYQQQLRPLTQQHLPVVLSDIVGEYACETENMNAGQQQEPTEKKEQEVVATPRMTVKTIAPEKSCILM